MVGEQNQNVTNQTNLSRTRIRISNAGCFTVAASVTCNIPIGIQLLNVISITLISITILAQTENKYIMKQKQYDEDDCNPGK